MCCDVVLYCVSIGCSAVRMWHHFLLHISTDWLIVYIYLCSIVEVCWEAYPLQTTLYKLKVLFRHRILGMNGNLGKFFKILMHKVYEKVKKFVA